MADLSEQLTTTLSSGRSDKGSPSLAEALSLSDHIPGKATKSEANYVPNGPPPYQCGNCRYLVWSGGKGSDLCQLVAGSIQPEAACRLFEAKPDTRQDGEDGGVHLTVVQPSTIGTYSDNPPVDDLRQTRLKPSRLLWRRDRWGWNDTGQPRSE